MYLTLFVDPSILISTWNVPLGDSTDTWDINIII